jgi:catalase
MNAFSAHTFRLVKSSDEWYYAKFVLVSDQGIKNNTLQESITVAGENPDFGITDLYDSSVSSCLCLAPALTVFPSVASGEFPSWKVYFQVLTPAQAEKFKYNVFDLTKEWRREDVPYQEVGRIVLNQNP